MGDWKLGATLAVGAAVVGAAGWMLAGIAGTVQQNAQELFEIHQDIGRLAANQDRILDAMQWRGGRPVMLAGNEPCPRNP